MIRENNKEISWTSIAYECGYSDQMHLVKEYKEFVGTAPSVIAEELNTAPFRVTHSLKF